MNKEHVFNIAVSVDDDAIRESVIRAAENQVTKAVMDGLLSKDYYGRVIMSNKFIDIISPMIQKVVEENKERIISEVIKNVTEKVFRSKAFKEPLKEVSPDE